MARRRAVPAGEPPRLQGTPAPGLHRGLPRPAPDERGAYSFWDYQGGAFQLDHGIRIDHHLLSPQAADRLVACTIDKAPRRLPKASDHTPVIVDLQV